MPWKTVTITVFLCVVTTMAGYADTVDLPPAADTFVVNPGSNPPLAKLIGEQDCDFGGAGSRAVASSAAFSGTNQAHGLFHSLLRFDASPTAGDVISNISLQLYTTRIMNGGLGEFNPAAESGYFDVSLMRLPSTSEWTQGYGAPETLTTHITDPTLGTTNTILNNTILPSASVVDLKTLYFDASQLSTTAVQTWVTYDLTCPALQNALSTGGLFTLLLSPAAGDNTVSFNFSCRNQNITPGFPPTLWDNGPHLIVEASASTGGTVTSATWVGTDGSPPAQSWVTATNWSSNPRVPGGHAGDSAIFADSIGSHSTTITLDGNQTLGSVVFSHDNGSSGYTYTIAAGSGNWKLIANSGTANSATVTVSAGKQLISAPVELDSNMQVNTAVAASVLAISGDINGDGTLVKAGPGTLILSGSDTYMGGTVVNAGTLIVASNAGLPNGTSLTIGAGGTLIFDPSQVITAQPTSAVTSEINPVPEPGTLTLLATAVCGAAVFRRSRSRRKKP